MTDALNPKKSFQALILTLNRFWAEQGCVILQPYDMEVGAGTFHPATTLRALGPKHWRAAYVQPSRRPTDGRYGENPNRLQHYYQYQVIMKPSPADAQELLLASYREIGLDPLKHDFRFVEDDWESPTLGAWGLGWEVWCDGMEVGQFTYFQQMGGFVHRNNQGWGDGEGAEGQPPQQQGQQNGQPGQNGQQANGNGGYAQGERSNGGGPREEQSDSEPGLGGVAFLQNGRGQSAANQDPAADEQPEVPEYSPGRRG